MRISVSDYFMGRDAIYFGDLTDEIKANAARTVEKVNSLLAVLEAEHVPLELHPKNGSIVASGWRPPIVNAQTKGAAVRSRHMTCEACDLYDPDGLIDDYLMDHQQALVALGLYLEHPLATKNWSHVQIVPPKSLKRVFMP